MATPGHVSERTRAGTKLRRRVWIAVEPPSLQRLIQHVLDGNTDLRVVTAASPLPSRVSPSLLAPDVIVINQRLQRQQPGDLVADLKRTWPTSTVILLTPPFGGPTPTQAADICLPEEAIVQALLPMIRQLTLRAADRTPPPASAGPRT